MKLALRTFPIPVVPFIFWMSGWDFTRDEKGGWCAAISVVVITYCWVMSTLKEFQ